MTGTRGAVAVVGAINVDLVVKSRRLPARGETVVGDGPNSFGGGKGANAAVAAARAGASVSLFGAVGSDQAGDGALAALVAEGVDVSGVARLVGSPTGVALIVVDAAGENQIAVGAGANGILDADTVKASLEPRLSGFDCVLISTEIPDDAVTAAVDLAVDGGIRCVVNPAPPTAAVVAAVPRGVLLTPNVGELEELLIRLGEAGALDAAAGAAALSRRSGQATIVTLGAEGVIVAGAVALELPARPVSVVDTTGAGDTFNGVLAARLAAGDEIEPAVRLAITAASVSVGSAGARDGMPRLAAIEAAAR